MINKIKGILFAICISLAGMIGLSSPASAQPASCSEVYVIAANGIGASGPNSIAEKWADVYEGRPGYHVSTLDYPQSFWPLGPYSYDASTQMGSQRMYDQVRWNQVNCPESQTILIGHSAGARVVDDTVTRLAREGYDYNVSADVIANPKRVGGVESTLSGLYPGASMTGPHGSYGNIPVRDTCRDGDGICDLPAFGSNPIGFIDGVAGYLFGKHGNYAPNPVAPTVTEEILIPDGPQIRELPPQVILPAPVVPQVSLPPINYGPLPNINDVAKVLNPGPYVPTPVRNYLPVEVQNVLPKEVLEFVPPPLPVLPRLF